MKIDRNWVSESVGNRVCEGDHLVIDAIQHYKGFRSKKAVRAAADHNRQHYAKEGSYLKALIHDQIYRLHGGED